MASPLNLLKNMTVRHIINLLAKKTLWLKDCWQWKKTYTNMHNDSIVIITTHHDIQEQNIVYFHNSSTNIGTSVVIRNKLKYTLRGQKCVYIEVNLLIITKKNGNINSGCFKYLLWETKKLFLTTDHILDLLIFKYVRYLRTNLMQFLLL